MFEPEHKTAAELAFSDRRPLLSAMLSPGKVPVIGASESAGQGRRALMENLQSFSGSVFAVNPNHSTILGQKAFSRIGEVQEDVDPAVIAMPRLRRLEHHDQEWKAELAL